MMWAEHVAQQFESGNVRSTPMGLARSLDPMYRNRDHLDYLDGRLAAAVRDVEQGENRFLSVSMPPRSGKSQLASVYLPLWLLHRHSDWKVGLISHSPELATSWGRQVRRMVEEHGPTLGVEIASDAGAVGRWETTRGGSVTSRSAPGQSVTGLGFKVLIMDDLVKDYAAAHSETQRKELWNWWLFNMQTRLEPPFLVIMVGTRWHEDDVIGRLMNAEYEGDPEQWERIVFPAIAEEDDVLGRAPGEPLLTPLYDETPEQALARWESVRAGVGSYSWAALYQQSPAPAKGAIFNADWWRFWTSNPEHATDDGKVRYIAPEELIRGRWLDSWDTSFKGTDSSDFVVGQRWCALGPDRVLVAQRRGRMSFTEALRAMRDWSTSTDYTVTNPYGRHVHLRVVEAAANGEAIIDVMKKEISGIRSYRPNTSKEGRARAVSPEIESEHVLLPYPGDPGNRWVVEDFLTEMQSFPTGTNDDQVDAMTQALLNLREEGRAGITVPGRVATNTRTLGGIAAAARTDLNRRRGMLQGGRYTR